MTLMLLSVVFGLMIGSFLNVCIYRMQREQSIIRPRSRCPACGASIAWYDNIPVISFLLLGGKCRNCSAAVSWRYSLVELLCALMAMGLVHRWQGQWLWLAGVFICACMLFIITFIDLDTFLIPDELSLGLVITGLVFSFVNPYLSGSLWLKPVYSLAGGAVGFILMWFLAVSGEKIFKKEAVGGGDLKLLAGIGAMLGWQGAASTLLLASFLGSVYGLSLMAMKKARRDDPIPFGPFLAAGAMINLFKFIPLSSFLLM
ncbi:MAG: prepilin peptidase [bacterium]